MGHESSFGGMIRMFYIFKKVVYSMQISYKVKGCKICWTVVDMHAELLRQKCVKVCNLLWNASNTKMDWWMDGGRLKGWTYDRVSKWHQGGGFMSEYWIVFSIFLMFENFHNQLIRKT